MKWDIFFMHANLHAQRRCWHPKCSMSVKRYEKLKNLLAEAWSLLEREIHYSCRRVLESAFRDIWQVHEWNRSCTRKSPIFITNSLIGKCIFHEPRNEITSEWSAKEYSIPRTHCLNKMRFCWNASQNTHSRNRCEKIVYSLLIIILEGLHRQSTRGVLFRWGEGKCWWESKPLHVPSSSPRSSSCTVALTSEWIPFSRFYAGLKQVICRFVSCVNFEGWFTPFSCFLLIQPWMAYPTWLPAIPYTCIEQTFWAFTSRRHPFPSSGTLTLRIH